MSDSSDSIEVQQVINVINSWLVRHKMTLDRKMEAKCAVYFMDGSGRDPVSFATVPQAVEWVLAEARARDICTGMDIARLVTSGPRSLLTGFLTPEDDDAD